ncbi:uncharacterized protein LOC135814649 [Sycon ciliatum]|uniref:uncharacterized protein LOC135814649 n=1 Tax=Sycon ciliatum TaxID=27933 RepID=UPI0031F6C12E
MSATLDKWLKPHSNPSSTSTKPPAPDFDEFDDVQLLEALQSAENECPGFDLESGTRWVYPTNLPVRQYQLDITRTALFSNTLVALPTGLGKTLIAAVVIYNFQRWYPSKKILFMAPTKPLVAQQIDACCNIMRLPTSHCCTVTGSSLPKQRTSLWKEKRIFFLTPQVVQNDLHRGICPAGDICLVVVDEAHRAQGRHSYVEVVRELHKTSKNIRVLGLSATPGENMQGVQQVVENLLISRVELRTEDSADVRQYAQDRSVEQMKVSLNDEIDRMKAEYLKLLTPLLQRLRSDGNLWISNMEQPTNLRNVLIVAKKKFQAGRQFNQNAAAMNSVDKDYAMALSLAHSFEILQTHGLWCLYQTLVTASSQRAPQMSVTGIRRIFSQLESHFSSADRLPGQPSAISHPKMAVLKEVVNAHFREHGESTRVIIFSQFRVSVEEIAATLRATSPLVSIAEFVGQSNSGSNSEVTSNQGKGLTQKEQQKVLDHFRTGRVNTLVATSVAEEGLDIGSVDLIVCFDVQQSSLRMVQRMGRTGRKRTGKVVVLLVPGIEDKLMAKACDKQKKLAKEIFNHANRLAYYSSSPRMVPSSVHPEPLMMPMDKEQLSQKPVTTTAGSAGITPAKKTPAAKERKRGTGKQQRSSLAASSASAMSSPLFQYATSQSAAVAAAAVALPSDSASSGSFLNHTGSMSRKHAGPAPLSCEEECAVIDCIHKFFRPPAFRSPRLRQLDGGEGQVMQLPQSTASCLDDQRLLTSVHRVEHSERTLAYVELINSCDDFSNSACELPTVSDTAGAAAALVDPMLSHANDPLADDAVGHMGDERCDIAYVDQDAADVAEQSDLVPIPPSLSSLFDNLSSQAVCNDPVAECREAFSPHAGPQSPFHDYEWEHPGNDTSNTSQFDCRPVWETAVEDYGQAMSPVKPLTSSTPCKVVLPQRDIASCSSSTRKKSACQRDWSPVSHHPASKQRMLTPSFAGNSFSPATYQAALEGVDTGLASPILFEHTSSRTPPSRNPSTASVLFSPVNGSCAKSLSEQRHHAQCRLDMPGNPVNASCTLLSATAPPPVRAAGAATTAAAAAPVDSNADMRYSVSMSDSVEDGDIVQPDDWTGRMQRLASATSLNKEQQQQQQQRQLEESSRMLPWLDLDLEEDDSEEMRLIEEAEAATAAPNQGCVGAAFRLSVTSGPHTDTSAAERAVGGFNMEEDFLVESPGSDPGQFDVPVCSSGGVAGVAASNLQSVSTDRADDGNNQVAVLSSPTSEGFDIDLTFDENLLEMIDSGASVLCQPPESRVSPSRPEMKESPRTPVCKAKTTTTTSTGSSSSKAAFTTSSNISSRHNSSSVITSPCLPSANGQTGITSPKLFDTFADDAVGSPEPEAVLSGASQCSMQSSMSDSSPVAVLGKRRRCAQPDWLASQPAPRPVTTTSTTTVTVNGRLPNTLKRAALIDSESDSSEETSLLKGTRSAIDATTTDESLLAPVRRKANILTDTSADLSDLSPPAKVSKKSDMSKRVRIQSDGTDSDFEAPSSKLLARKKPTVQTNSKHVKIIQPAAASSRKKGTRVATHHLLDCEAEVDDGEGCSSDEDVNNTYYDINDSFIDDGSSQMLSSQPVVEEKRKKSSTDMHAVYLQSLRSPQNGNALFGGRRHDHGRHGGMKLRVSHRHQFLRQALGYGDSVSTSVSTDEEDEAEEDNAVHDMMSASDNSELMDGDPLGDEGDEEEVGCDGEDGESSAASFQEQDAMEEDDVKEPVPSSESSHSVCRVGNAVGRYGFRKPSSDEITKCSNSTESVERCTTMTSDLRSRSSSLPRSVGVKKEPERGGFVAAAVKKEPESGGFVPSTINKPGGMRLMSRLNAPSSVVKVEKSRAMDMPAPSVGALQPGVLASMSNVVGQPKLTSDSGGKFVKFPKRQRQQHQQSPANSTAAGSTRLLASGRKGLSLSTRGRQSNGLAGNGSPVVPGSGSGSGGGNGGGGNWLDDISMEDIDSLTAIASSNTNASASNKTAVAASTAATAVLPVPSAGISKQTPSQEKVTILRSSGQQSASYTGDTGPAAAPKAYVTSVSGQRPSVGKKQSSGLECVALTPVSDMDTCRTVDLTGEQSSTPMSGNRQPAMRKQTTSSVSQPSSASTMGSSTSKEMEPRRGADQNLHILVGTNYPPYQQILSGLRHRHSHIVTCHFCQLQHTGVVVSQRMVVECVTSADLSSVNRRRQLSQRIQQHRIHFARVTVLVQSSNGTDLLSSGCEDFLSDIISASRVLLLWSCTIEDTVSVLVDLAKRESTDHDASIVATPQRYPGDKMVELLCTISAITLTTAMQIKHVFGSIAKLCDAASSPACLRQHLNFISQRQAKNLAYFFSVQFNPVMLPR